MRIPQRLIDEVKAQEFTVTTKRDPQEIEAAINRAAAHAKRFGGTSIKLVARQDHGIRSQVVAGLIGSVKMTIDVEWTELGEGRRNVRLIVQDNFQVTQPMTFGIIPSGPKKVTGLWSLRRFAESLRADLQ